MQFIGRTTELNYLNTQRNQFIKNEIDLFEVVYGEAGIGKTTLINHLLSGEDDCAIMHIDWRSESVDLELLGDGTLDPDAVFYAFRNAAGANKWGKQFNLYNRVRKDILATRELVENALEQSGTEVEIPKSELDVAMLASVASELLALAARTAVPQMGWAAEIIVGGLSQVGIQITLKHARGLLAKLQAFMRDNFSQTEFDYFIHPDQQLASAVARGLLKISEKQKLIVVMDGYEEIVEVDQWVRHIVEAAGPNVGWIFGSRVDLETMDISQRFPYVGSLELKPFNQLETNALVEATKGYLFSADELAELMEKSGGNPGEILEELEVEYPDEEITEEVIASVEPEVFDPVEMIAPVAQAVLEKPADFAVSTMPDFVSLGDQFMKEGARDEAYASYQRALEKNPESARAWSGLGNLFRGQNRVAEAERCYRKAMDCGDGDLRGVMGADSLRSMVGEGRPSVLSVKSGIDSAEILLSRAHYFLRNDEIDHAVSTLEHLLSFTAERAEPLLLLAQTFFKKNDFASAERLYKQAEPIFSSDQFPYHELGAVQMTLGLLKDALTTMQKGVAHQPRSPEMHLGLGHVHMLDGRAQDADASFETATFLVEKDRPDLAAKAFGSFGELFSRLDLIHAAERYYFQSVEAVSDYAVGLAGLGRVRRKYKDDINATKYLNRALKSDPNHSQTYYEQGRLLEKAGDDENALYAYARARQTAPADTRSHERFGLLADKIGLVERATEGYIAAIHSRSTNPLVYQKYGDILFDRGEYARAANMFESAFVYGATPNFSKVAQANAEIGNHARAEWASEQQVASSDATAQDWVVLGDCAYACNRLDRAETAYRHALTLEQDHPAAHLGLGRVLPAQQAVSHLKICLRQEPDNLQAQLSLAENLAKIGNYDASLIAYSDVIEQNPRNVSAWLGLASVSETKGAAIEDLKTILEACVLHNPSCGEAHAKLGQAYLLEEAPEKAEEAFGKALGSNPADARWQRGLADARFRQGAFETAYDSYKASTLLETECPSGYIGSGHCLYALGKLEEAQVVYEDALQLGASDREMDANLAEIYLQMGRAEKAEVIYRRFVNQDRGENRDVTVGYLRNLGHVYHLQGKARDGITVYEKAVRFNDDSAVVRSNMGDLYHLVGNDPIALASYQRATELDPALVEPWLASAAIHQENGNPAHAEAIYERAIEHHPQNPQILRSFAGTALRNGDRETSQRFYDEAQAAGDDSAELHTGFGDIALANNFFPLAESHYIDALQRDSDYTPAILGKTLCRLADNDLKATRIGIARCGELAGQSAPYHRVQGVIAFTDKKYQDAISNYESAKRLDSEVLSQSDLLNLGTCYQFTNQPVPAHDLYHGILQADPDNTQAQIGYGLSLHWLQRDEEALEWLEKAKTTAPKEKSLWIALGHIYANNEAWQESINAYSTALKNVEEGTRDSAEIRTAIGDAHKKLEDDQSAIRAYRTAISDTPNPDATLSLAQLYLRQNRFNDAKALLETDVFGTPESSDLLRTRLDLYSSIRDYDNAKTVLREILRRYPSDTPAMLAQADIALEQKKYPVAERSYERILNLDSTHAEACAGMGMVYLHTGREVRADNHFNSVLKRDPDNIKAHLGRALIALGRGETELAFKRLNQITESYPQESQAWVTLGHCANAMNDLTLAVDAYQKAIELNPYNQSAYSSLAECFLKLEEYNSAKTIYEQALDIYQNDLHSQIGLAATHRHLGNTDAGNALLEEVRPHIKKESVYNQACFQSVAGNEEDAIKLLKLAYSQVQFTAEELLSEPELVFIHETDGFRKFLQQLN